ncbi:DUF4303 domain-containing protein [Rhodopirellula europaea]|jgi:hypothetical protein|uniref:DUF4303 domain-containing protein n=1 Tax=Rhodopirellula europaea SH398 TaxID=1263868 RepID=M5RYT8_9BACT|nr:DUF4303 domain-containing protein [Rhodopirellula europaea]EMI24361.1 hypothetical protein RESH_05060 [Rhodopirellula europaea SH398]
MAVPTVDELTASVVDAATLAFRKLFATGETFYYCVLITTGEALPPCIAAWSHESLARSDQPELDRWHYADSPFLDFGAEHFAPVRDLWLARPAIGDGNWNAEYELRLTALESAMRNLDSMGVFGSGESRRTLMINVEVVPPDHTNTERAIRLNPPESIAQWIAEAAEPRDGGTVA